MTKITWILLVGMSLLGVNAYSSEIKVSGGAAPLSNIFRKIKSQFEQKTGHTLVLIESIPGNALIALDKGEVDLATAGVSFDKLVEMAKESGHEIKDKASFVSRGLGRDYIQVFVHKNNSVASLDEGALKKLFTGEAKDWKEVAGSGGAVQVVIGDTPGTNSYFQTTVMGGAAWSPQAIHVKQAGEIVRKISGTSGGVGIGPQGLDLTGLEVKAVKVPEIGRPLIAVTKGRPSGAVLELLNFISTSGK